MHIARLPAMLFIHSGLSVIYRTLPIYNLRFVMSMHGHEGNKLIGECGNHE